MSEDKIKRKDTDATLPKHVANGFMRYDRFESFADGGVCHLDTCRDKNLGRRVILKTLHPHVMENEEEVARFLREARVTAQLTHPSTIPIYELSRDNKGRPYFTMKRIQGVDLRKVLESLAGLDEEMGNDFPLDRLLDVLIQVGECLAFAHAHGVVHRDIKPANIIVGSFGEVMVLDWGLAKVWDEAHDDVPAAMGKEMLSQELTHHGRIHGTPLYMSPEQATGDAAIDHRTDVYSLGAVLYEILTLQNLVWGQDADEVRKMIKEDEPEPPRRRSPERRIPVELDAICMRAIAKQPDDRYGDVRGMIEDLRNFRAGRPVVAYQDSAAGFVVKWLRTHRNWLVGLMLAGSGLLGGLLVHLYHLSR